MSRVVLKFSGEALKDGTDAVSEKNLEIINDLIKLLVSNHHKVGIIIGGGNFFRGREHTNMDKVTADTIGMLGTVMNALYIKDYLNKNKVKAEVSTPFNFPGLINDYTNEELKELYDKNTVIIFGGGVGKSGFSTDSGLVLAMNVLDADTIVKMTNVDGVYDNDPKLVHMARLYRRISYKKVLEDKLNVIDEFAVKECMNKNAKILVMNINKYKQIIDYFNGFNPGTIIGDIADE